jgi:hypothetical protein
MVWGREEINEAAGNAVDGMEGDMGSCWVDARLDSIARRLRRLTGYNEAWEGRTDPTYRCSTDYPHGVSKQ